MKLINAIACVSLLAAQSFSLNAQAQEQPSAKPKRQTSAKAQPTCRDKATAFVDTAARREKETGDVLFNLLIFGGIAGAIITSISNENDKQAAIDTVEKRCLAGKPFAAPQSAEEKATTAAKVKAARAEPVSGPAWVRRTIRKQRANEAAQ
jgi:hypothetical protein